MKVVFVKETPVNYVTKANYTYRMRDIAIRSGKGLPDKKSLLEMSERELQKYFND